MVLSSILIKVKTINKVTNFSMRDSQRNLLVSPQLLIDARKLKWSPIYVIVMVVTYLLIWTLVDPTKPTQTLALKGDVVTVVSSCSSTSKFWLLVAYSWQMIMIISASVLTYQSVNVVKEFNESRCLSTMIYSQFLFLILRITFSNLSHIESFSGLQTPLVSIILSVDCVTGTYIYMRPKLCPSLIEDQQRTQSIISSRPSLTDSNSRNGILQNSHESSSRSSLVGATCSFTKGRGAGTSFRSSFADSLTNNGVLRNSNVSRNSQR